MLGYPPPPLPPPGSLAADRPTRRPPRFGSTKGGAYSPQNCRTPLGVTHWLAAAPVGGGFFWARQLLVDQSTLFSQQFRHMLQTAVREVRDFWQPSQ